MKKFVSVAAALLLSSSLFANQNGPAGVYVGAGLGLEAMPKYFDNGLGLSIKGGASLDSVLNNFGVEAELTTSLIAPDIHGVDYSVTTLGFYGTYTIHLPNSAFALRPKFGFILPNLNDEINSRDLAVSGGLAGLYTLNRQVDIYVEYVNASEMLSNYTIGVNFNF